MILFRKSEIRNLDDRINVPLAGGHQNVLRFQITVRNPMFMNVLLIVKVLDGTIKKSVDIPSWHGISDEL